MRSNGTSNLLRWLRENMDPRDRTKYTVPLIGGFVLLVTSFFGPVFGDRAYVIAAVSLVLIITGYVNAIVSVLRVQERRLQALESKQSSEAERPS